MNPVLSKELRQRLRNYKGMLVLFIYLLILGSFTLGFMYLNWQHTAVTFNPEQSFSVFAVLTVFQLVLLGFVIPGLTAGAISGERERQTLNVSLITELSPLKIITGKMLSATAFTGLLLLASLPLYGLILLFGGINPLQLLNIFGFYLVTIFLFAAIGITCSTFFKRTGVSTVVAYGLVAFIGAGTGFLAIFVELITPHPYPMGDAPIAPIVSPESIYYYQLVVQYLLAINPVAVLMGILEGGNIPGIGTSEKLMLPYWAIYSLFYLSISVLMLLGSARRLNPLRKK